EEGSVASPKQDVYSLAATLFHLVTGELPFKTTSNTPFQQMKELNTLKQQGLSPKDSRCASLPQPLVELLPAGLTPDPAQRPELKDFLSALRGLLTPPETIEGDHEAGHVPERWGGWVLRSLLLLALGSPLLGAALEEVTARPPAAGPVVARPAEDTV